MSNFCSCQGVNNYSSIISSVNHLHGWLLLVGLIQPINTYIGKRIMLHLYCAGRCAFCVHIPSKDSARREQSKKGKPKVSFFALPSRSLSYTKIVQKVILYAFVATITVTPLQSNKGLGENVTFCPHIFFV